MGGDVADVGVIAREGVCERYEQGESQKGACCWGDAAQGEGGREGEGWSHCVGLVVLLARAGRDGDGDGVGWS